MKVAVLYPIAALLYMGLIAARTADAHRLTRAIEKLGALFIIPVVQTYSVVTPSPSAAAPAPAGLRATAASPSCTGGCG